MLCTSVGMLANTYGTYILLRIIIHIHMANQRR